ncbi:MAG: hypothetical protein Q8N26_25135 [Myxococcales bacterium]|nr:hypothetical protein [Myxococcales bacterium]
MGSSCADDFEAITGTRLTSANSGWNNIYGTVNITRTAANVNSGAAAAEIAMPSANAVGGWRDFGTNGFETLFVRYYLKYHSNYPGVHHQGMTIFAGAPGVTTGSSTGMRPNGTNHFTVGLDNLNPRFSWSPPGNATPGYLSFYTYHMDQMGSYGDTFLPSGDWFQGQPALFGPTFVSRPRVIPPRGQWVCFELMVKSNTPGQRDGRIAFWVDGRLAADFPNLRFRTTASLKPNFVVLAPYSSEVLPNQVLWYDDVVAATSYIGPRVTSARDAGVSPADAGMPRDAGLTQDAGASFDAGARLDAGAPFDAGPSVPVVDAGTPNADDAGASADAGTTPSVMEEPMNTTGGCSSIPFLSVLGVGAWLLRRRRS